MPRFKQGRNDLDIGTTFRIPNDESGLAFIKQLRAHAVRGVRVRVRARGPRVKWAPIVNRTKRSLRQDLPREFAHYFAVYVDKVSTKKKAREAERSAEYWRLWEQAKRIPELEQKMQKLAAEVQAKKLFVVPITEKSFLRRKFRFDA